MLFESLFISAVMLIVANVAVAKSRYAAAWVVAAGIICTLLPCFMLEVFLAVGIQALLLCGLLFVLLIPRCGRWIYLIASCFATLGAYGAIVGKAVKQEGEMAELRKLHPLLSLEDQLPKGSGIPAPLKNINRLDSLERNIEREIGSFDSRSGGLKAIHERSVQNFVDSAGFGVGRMPRQARTDASFLRTPEDSGPVPQPQYLTPFVVPTGPLRDDIPKWEWERVEIIHDMSVLDFLNPSGFGYFKSRREVAGFQSHRMSKVPGSPAPWKVARVELVGLLMHGEVVYPSESLPRMNDLRNAPVRPLDAFESEGLESLKKGEDMFVRGTDDKARMLGAIRATKQCLECHGGNRGNLLGAFSYGFRRDVK